jgi:hypothetical protein
MRLIDADKAVEQINEWLDQTSVVEALNLILHLAKEWGQRIGNKAE